jgi:hypothetical protein
VRRVRLGSILGGIAVLAALLSTQAASAATLTGDYQLQGTLSSSGPGAPLANLGIGTNGFQADTVMGTSRQVLTFPLHNGLALNPAGIVNSTFSAVVTLRLTNVSGLAGYARILENGNGTLDSGFYSFNGKATYYDDGTAYLSPATLLGNNVYATVAMTQAASPPVSTIYVNGNLGAQGQTSYPVINDTLRFFKDNVSGGTTNEDSAGAVSCIRVFNGVLTGAEVAAIGASPTCTAPAPAPGSAIAPVTKKCKKKHKNRSAQFAKKCKKHKKR